MEHRSIRKRTFALGTLFGLLVPYIGMFLGLQVSTKLGNIFAFPVILLVAITDKPFGTWNIWLFLTAALISIAFWTLIFAALDKALQKKKSK